MKTFSDPELDGRQVVELGAQKLKLSGPRLSALNQTAQQKITGLRFGLKINKECFIEIEVSSSVHISQRKRILLST